VPGMISGRARPRLSRSVRVATRFTLTAALLAGGVAAAVPSQAAANPFERGPAPTQAGLERPGPFQVGQLQAQNALPGFAAGRIYYPTDTTQGTFGAVAIVPGFVSSWESIQWIGPRLASHGFVVIGIDTLTPTDIPADRGNQVLAALDNLLNDRRVNSRIDRSRTALAGWSMGGGGVLEAARNRPGLKAIVPWAPWDIEKNFSGVRVPTLIIGDEFDELAPVDEHAIPFYNTVSTPSKAYANLNNTDHFFVWNDNPIQSRLTVSWLKRYVDNDTRYSQFLCPGPAVDPAFGLVQDYRARCPL